MIRGFMIRPPIPVYSMCDHLTDAPVLPQYTLMFFLLFIQNISPILIG